MWSPTEVPPEKEAPEKEDWRKTAPAIVSEMRSMTKEASLEQLASLDIPAATELQTEGVELGELPQFAGGIRNAVAAASWRRNNEGRRTFQTLLTAVAHDGDDDTKLTLKRKSELIGVNPGHSRPRAGVLNHWTRMPFRRKQWTMSEGLTFLFIGERGQVYRK
ncbi:unnamed protein product [Pylaiella littoralis]